MSRHQTSDDHDHGYIKSKERRQFNIENYKWGTKIVEKLSIQVKQQYPNLKGFDTKEDYIEWFSSMKHIDTI